MSIARGDEEEEESREDSVRDPISYRFGLGDLCQLDGQRGEKKMARAKPSSGFSAAPQSRHTSASFANTNFHRGIN